MARETGLAVDPSRFEPLCATSMTWQKRKQPPEDNGTADVQAGGGSLSGVAWRLQRVKAVEIVADAC